MTSQANDVNDFIHETINTIHLCHQCCEVVKVCDHLTDEAAEECEAEREPLCAKCKGQQS